MTCCDTSLVSSHRIPSSKLCACCMHLSPFAVSHGWITKCLRMAARYMKDFLSSSSKIGCRYNVSHMPSPDAILIQQVSNFRGRTPTNKISPNMPHHHRECPDVPKEGDIFLKFLSSSSQILPVQLCIKAGAIFESGKVRSESGRVGLRIQDFRFRI